MVYYLILPLSILLVFFGWRLFFLRNPNRTIPTGNHFVAPADGTIIYIKKIEKGFVPVAVKNGEKIPLTELTGVESLETIGGYLVGVFMNPMSVHRNRIPISGEIVAKKYLKKPNNLSMVKATTDILLRRKSFPDYDFYLTNERLTILINAKDGVVGVTQIADKWIRKIVSWVEVGDVVSMGEQYGMIRFGSQCDLFIPESIKFKFKVKVGDYVYAGKSILAEIIDKE